MQRLCKAESTASIEASENKHFGIILPMQTCTAESLAIERVQVSFWEKEDKILNLETKKKASWQTHLDQTLFLDIKHKNI